MEELFNPVAGDDAFIAVLIGVLHAIGPWFAILAALVALGMIISRSLARLRGEYVSFTGPIAMALMSAGAAIAPIVLPSPHSTSDPAPSSSPDPTPTTPSPSHSPVISEGPPVVPPSIVLPRVENLDTLWLIPIALISVGAIAFLLLSLWRTARKARAENVAKTAARTRLEEEWQTVVEQHESLLRRYLHAETDWDMLFNYPALIDVTVPTTSRMLTAMHEAGQLSRSFPAAEISDTTNIASLPYPQAVAQFQQAWDRAEEYARKAGQSMLPAADRKTIREIRVCLDMAENPAASPQERQLAARRARSLMDSLTSLNVPRKALDAIESVQRLSIEASSR